MSNRRANTQMFALPAGPPERLIVRGAAYRLIKVFKHDFFAATCLYELAGGTGFQPVLPTGATPHSLFPRLVAKLYRTQPFCGFPLAWLGRASRDHERAIYAALSGVAGLPRWVDSLGESGFAVECLDARPIDHFERPPGGYFERLRAVFDAVHARGVAYVDANKRSNILVDSGGRAYLVDFQISLRRRDDLPWPIRSLVTAVVRWLQRQDLYHLYKHKRRLSPGELTDQEQALSRRRGPWHWVHRKLIKPYKRLRRGFLRRQHQAGRLVSPSAGLENHHQPEKETWRK